MKTCSLSSDEIRQNLHLAAATVTSVHRAVLYRRRAILTLFSLGGVPTRDYITKVLIRGLHRALESLLLHI